jgi:hypothetical protein
VKTEDGFEVDFHAFYPDGTEELIQVCADPAPPDVREREFRGLASARKEYPRAGSRLLVLTHDQIPGVSKTGVTVEPVYQWLLDAG